MSNEIAIQNECQPRFTFLEIERMGVAVAKSGLFGVKTPEQAIAILLLAQAEGIHPMCAARDYHIMDVKGSLRPSMKAETMLARFQSAGGTVKWNEYTDKKVSGTFSHPSGGSLTVEWTIERAKECRLLGSPDKPREVWKFYPAAMLRSRVISEAIRTVYPGVLSGLYSPDEVENIPVIDAEPAFKEPQSKPETTAKPRERHPKPEPPVAEIVSDRISPEQVEAVQQKWNIITKEMTKEMRADNAKYIRDRFSFQNFEDIKSEQLIEILVAMDDMQGGGNV